MKKMSILSATTPMVPTETLFMVLVALDEIVTTKVFDEPST